MDNVSVIAAVGKNDFELGFKNGLIWHLKSDLKFFREVTMGKDIVMGSKTFYSLPKLLPGRRHIVLTRNNIDNPSVIVKHSIEELIEYLKETKKEVMIIGGASIYEQMLEYADKMYLTHIDDAFSQADAFFPNFNYNDWEEEILQEDIDDGIRNVKKLYRRIK